MTTPDKISAWDLLGSAPNATNPRSPAPKTVTTSISLNLDNLAHALVHTLDGDSLSSFIYNVIGLRDDKVWLAEFIAELVEPYETPAPSSTEDTPAAPERRVWQVGDQAIWRGRIVTIVRVHTFARTVDLNDLGTVLTDRDYAELSEVASPGTTGEPA